MQHVGIIGQGAIASYVARGLRGQGQAIAVWLLRPSHLTTPAKFPGLRVAAVDELPDDLDVMIDCAGHAALAQHGPALLARGIQLITLSIGALADPALYHDLEQATGEGGGRLTLASGALGALDCLQAAKVGGLHSVTYVGRKPPKGWLGSPAEEKLDLASLSQAACHFEGSARRAAQLYPKNANVAAAVALAGLGFDDTRVQLIADPHISLNRHEIQAEGAFGNFQFQINGASLPDNPRSSALAAMSALAALNRSQASIGF